MKNALRKAASEKTSILTPSGSPVVIFEVTKYELLATAKTGILRDAHPGSEEVAGRYYNS
jgi:hypothetical protein